ncbi:MAG: hypothetical protein SPE66_11330 [Bilifractor sp.]|nr:hypothetical protein [Bilifractor sp.]
MGATGCAIFEFLDVEFVTGENMVFPNFLKGSMYEGMEPGRCYTIEELGLDLDQKEEKR